MAKYAFQRRLPSYFVNRAFLKDAELFIQEKARNFQGENYNPEQYTIEIQDSLGTQTLASIDDFHYSEFPNDTRSIRLKHETYHPQYFVIRLTLDQEPKLQIDLRSESPRQQALGISAEAEHVLSSSKNNHRFWEPGDKLRPTLVGVILVLVSVSGPLLTALGKYGLKIGLVLFSLSIL